MRGLAATIAVCLSAAPAVAGPGADVVFIGEVHDNPAHHAVQAARVAELAPAALVFEMLEAGVAARVTEELRRDAAALEAALGWAESGWPDFAMYYPIFTAAPEARIYGAAIPRELARTALNEGAEPVFDGDAARFGLTEPLPEDQQAAREAMQASAHCDMLPEALLPGMVMVQRLRDAELARVAEIALSETGGPVAVITGTGHARPDWGAPFLLRRAAPEITIVTIGQAEEGAEFGAGFDELIITPPIPREDPCAAFR
ncbi:ChaN family lipoprotein [Poseidonocella sedimentorum]|uniref:Uncharacterized iron-regulated protein n=1 Tax=Poseidonocella sedimentorum TaxID=871652 RepID=A0A1I6DSF2_9RHOB|nr:ChaN family lipoprotein [Poseidonocella sedimentorum]SFR08379.1 Uncharacterized iron-regulated protein [Poseidonocella sedimentorum]